MATFMILFFDFYLLWKLQIPIVSLELVRLTAESYCCGNKKFL